MIPRAFITEWRATAPWIEDAWVEQDLIISRALVEMFRVGDIAGMQASSPSGRSDSLRAGMEHLRVTRKVRRHGVPVDPGHGTVHPSDARYPKFWP